MPKFRKKPVEIEAKQYTGDNLRDILEFIGGTSGHWQADGNKIVIYTLEGNHNANIGDWIIKGIKGEYYPCKPDIFEATYEAVSGEGTTTKQMEGAPKGALFVWCNGHVDYPIRLARKIGREDLRIVSLSILWLFCEGCYANRN